MYRDLMHPLLLFGLRDSMYTYAPRSLIMHPQFATVPLHGLFINRALIAP